MNITTQIDGVEYTFRPLNALEYGNIIDNAESQQVSNRRLVAASTGLEEKQVEELPLPIFSRLFLEYSKVNAPKGLDDLIKKSTTSPKP